MIHTYEKNPIMESWISTLRHPESTRAHCKDATRNIGEALAIEYAKTLQTTTTTITTVLNESAKHKVLANEPILIPILRAGFPLYEGAARVFANAKTGFVDAKRTEQTLDAKITYSAIPAIEGQDVLICDTMLASGNTLLAVTKYLQEQKPKSITALIGFTTPDSITNISTTEPNLHLYIAQVDQRLNENSYILPGIGDAGDRCYGKTK